RGSWCPFPIPSAGRSLSLSPIRKPQLPSATHRLARSCSQITGEDPSRMLPACLLPSNVPLSLLGRRRRCWRRYHFVNGTLVQRSCRCPLVGGRTTTHSKDGD